jgi:hypothetical protein
MTLDIHQLDKLESDDEAEAEEAFERYCEMLMMQFAQSAEGQTHLQIDPDMGFWAEQLVDFGYTYVDVSLPKMTAADVEQIVTEVFPRKISLSSPNDADHAIAELIAFWQYLKREYRLRNADSILRVLRQITASDFKHMMNDPSRFGMAKSFFMMGQSAGFDMTSEKDVQQFMDVYNTSLLAQGPDLRSSTNLESRSDTPEPFNAGKDVSKQKKVRKQARASRKKNRKKRK